MPSREVEALRRDFPDVDVIDTRTREELDAAVPEADILFSWAFGDEVIARAKRLRWLHVPAAGVGSYLTPSFRASGAVITNSRGAHAIPIAEHVMAGLLGIARRMKAGIVEQTTTGMIRENWWAEDQVPDELHGKTIGLFGYGAIGREVARRAVSFGMRVIALRRRPHGAPAWDPELLQALDLPAEEPPVAETFGPGDLDRFLGRSDVVVVSAALTQETEGALGRAQFARMKPGAWLVNIARGKIVQEAELVTAVREGRIRAAALDVYEREPLPRESPLYTLDRVILTPHVSGLSRGFWPRAMALFRANLRRDARGEPLLNRVDPDLGY
ncbi:MAG TPA: D-2-hydroxyacid dehydrogenase [Candidatus Eisenbacteria bacterium]|nr:D-2-hydroxyacid dehydrogenase [Candidatus Eisenbacteria bacterium]